MIKRLCSRRERLQITGDPLPQKRGRGKMLYLHASGAGIVSDRGAGSDRAHHQREHEGSCVVVSAVVVEDGMQNALGEQTHIYASLQMVFA